jgi:hypothetical protein
MERGQYPMRKQPIPARAYKRPPTEAALLSFDGIWLRFLDAKL